MASWRVNLSLDLGPRGRHIPKLPPKGIFYAHLLRRYNLLIITCDVHYTQFGFMPKKKTLKSFTGKLLFNNKIIKSKIIIIKVTYVMN